jgi:pimeloyl-ACP methyl ester carboxylesterase
MTMAVDSLTDQREVPEWYRSALANEPEIGELLVDGVRISTRTWGAPGGEGIVLVHGGAAHARWWDHIAPLLAAHHRVVALDLSGDGDSGTRQSYSLDSWATEVLAVGASSGFAEPATLVGHSMGGLVSLRAAAIAGQDLTGLILIDTPVTEAPPEDVAASDKIAFGPKRIYSSREEAISRFVRYRRSQHCLT